MIAGIAIVVVGVAWIVVFWKQQEKNREAARKDEAVQVAISRTGVILTEAIESAGRSTDRLLRETVDSLAPLCESLAESLAARMDTINGDMADLRTRVENGPGKRTLSL